MKPHFSPAFGTPTLVFFSGVLAFDERGVIGGDVVEQTLFCLNTLEGLLRTSGLERSDVVKTTVWLTREEDFVLFNETYARFFGNHRPARSTLICRLALPEALVEIEAIAQRPGAAVPRSRGGAV